MDHSRRALMTDTTPAALRAQLDSPIAEAVQRQLQELASPDEAGPAAGFAESFFAKAPSDFLHERSADALAHLVLGAFRFLRDAPPDRVVVQVENPSVEREGWSAPVTVVRTSVSDRPFIIDTIREYLHSQHLAIEYMIYPALYVGRDASGRVTEIRPGHADEPKHSLVHAEVSQVTDPGELARIEREVTRRLQDVVRA